VLAQDGGIDVPREIALEVQPPRPVSGNRDQGHEGPVAEQEQGRGRQEAAAPDPQIEQGGEEVADPDPLENTHDPHVLAVKDEKREHVERQPDSENDSCPPQRMDQKRHSPFAFRRSPRKGERHRNADDEEKKGEDRVGVRPAVPLGVKERRVDVLPGARRVHHQHSRDRGSSEDVEGNEAISDFKLVVVDLPESALGVDFRVGTAHGRTVIRSPGLTDRLTGPFGPTA
jgi:hypothetical protein